MLSHLRYLSQRRSRLRCHRYLSGHCLRRMGRWTVFRGIAMLDGGTEPYMYGVAHGVSDRSLDPGKIIR